MKKVLPEEEKEVESFSMTDVKRRRRVEICKTRPGVGDYEIGLINFKKVQAAEVCEHAELFQYTAMFLH